MSDEDYNEVASVEDGGLTVYQAYQAREINEDEVFEYLDGLRESGVTNMWGAPAYVEREFDLSPEDAESLFFRWKRTFSERHPVRRL